MAARFVSAAAALAMAAAVLAFPAAARAQDAVAAAKEAYGNAEYDRCLTVLESATIPSEDAVAAGEYRALCLVALDREPDAVKVIESVLRAQPLYKVAPGASPRLKDLVSRVKRTALPAILQERYAIAKKAYDSRNYKEAAEGFRTVVAGLDDPAFDPDDNASLGDLKTVAAGFLDLMAAAPPPPPVVPAPAAPQPQPIFSGADTGVTAPEIIDQTLPAWRPDPSFVRTRITLSGTVEVIIDEAGAVQSARLIGKIHPDYDARLLRAALTWKYRPARQDGKAVKFRKLIQVTLKPS